MRLMAVCVCNGALAAAGSALLTCPSCILLISELCSRIPVRMGLRGSRPTAGALTSPPLIAQRRKAGLCVMLQANGRRVVGKREASGCSAGFEPGAC